MKIRSIISQGFLWLFVILAGIVTGGSIFEHLVIMPLWIGNPPDSVMAWQYPGIQGAFFGKFSPVLGIVSLGLVIVSFMMPPRQKKWALIAGILGIIVIVWTFLFFLPMAMKLINAKTNGLSSEEIVNIVKSWHTWQWGRWTFLTGGWIMALRALSLSGVESNAG